MEVMEALRQVDQCVDPTSADRPGKSRRKRDKIRLAAKLADWLGETEEEPRRQVGVVVAECGVRFAYEHVMKALLIERRGGMERRDGKGRRTPGGVFFFLIRRRLGREQFAELMAKGAVLAALPPRPERKKK